MFQHDQIKRYHYLKVGCMYLNLVDEIKLSEFLMYVCIMCVCVYYFMI